MQNDDVTNGEILEAVNRLVVDISGLVATQAKLSVDMVKLSASLVSEIRLSEKRLIARMDDKFDIQDKKILGVEKRLSDEIKNTGTDLGEKIDDLAMMTKHALDKKADLEYA